MKLLNAIFHHVRSLGQREVDLSPAVAARRPFLVTGGAATGKTTFLEALIVAKEAGAPYGLAPTAPFRVPGREDGRIVLRWRAERDEHERLRVTDPHVTTTCTLSVPAPENIVKSAELRMLMGRYDRDRGRFKVEYFHSARGFDAADRLSTLDFPAAEGARRLTRHHRKYAWIRRYLEAVATDEATARSEQLDERGLLFASARPRVLEGFASNVATLSPRLRWAGAKRSDGATQLLFAVKDRGEVELGDLSDSQRMIVLYAATIHALGLDAALVLVDQPELTLHPEEHVSFLDGLASLVPNGQIIAATSAPALLRAAAPEHVHVLS